MGLYRSNSTAVELDILQSGNFNAEAKKYAVDTSTAGLTMTLPATPQLGDRVYVKDFRGTFADATKGLTVNRNGQNIEGIASNIVLNTKWYAGHLTFVGGSVGWTLYPARLSYNPVFA